MAIKSNAKTRLILVLLLTSLTSDNDRIRGIMCGADDFLRKPVNKHELLARVYSLLRLKQFIDELDNVEAVLFSLALSIEAKDPYTEGHCERLSKYSVAVADKLSLPEELRVAIRRGGLIHDIGKLAVPESILLKPGPLTPEERKIMEQHTVADNPNQQKRIQILKPLVEKKLGELQVTIDLRRKEGLASANKIVLEGSGKRWMDQIRAVLSEMTNEEEALFAGSDGTDQPERDSIGARRLRRHTPEHFIARAVFRASDPPVVGATR